MHKSTLLAKVWFKIGSFLRVVPLCSETDCFIDSESLKEKSWHNIIEDVISTVNFLNIRTPKKIVVITLKLELYGSTVE